MIGYLFRVHNLAYHVRVVPMSRSSMSGNRVLLFCKIVHDSCYIFPGIIYIHIVAPQVARLLQCLKVGLQQTQISEYQLFYLTQVCYN